MQSVSAGLYNAIICRTLTTRTWSTCFSLMQISSRRLPGMTIYPYGGPQSKLSLKCTKVHVCLCGITRAWTGLFHFIESYCSSDTGGALKWVLQHNKMVGDFETFYLNIYYATSMHILYLEQNRHRPSRCCNFIFQLCILHVCKSFQRILYKKN